jgi:hypothetical protein
LLFILFIFAAQVQTFQVASTECILLDHGTKLLTILAADILLVNGLSVLWALVAVRVKTFMWRWKRCRDPQSDIGDPMTLHAHFELSDELLQICYRQFVTFVGCMVFPLIPLVALLGFILEYFVSRLMMLRLTQPPKFIDSRLGWFHFVTLLVIAFCAFFFYPIGPLFLLYLPRTLPASPLYRNCTMFAAILSA